MTLSDLLNKHGLLQDGRKVFCPFHGPENRPSAVLNETNIHCFTCARTYSIPQIFNKLGEQSNPEIKELSRKESDFSYKEILFLL